MPDPEATVKNHEPVLGARRTRRVQSLNKGRLILDGSEFGVDCALLDMSPRGSRIRLSKDISASKAHKLQLIGTDKFVRIRVAWQRGREVGIEFNEWPGCLLFDQPTEPDEPTPTAA